MDNSLDASFQKLKARDRLVMANRSCLFIVIAGILTAIILDRLIDQQHNWWPVIPLSLGCSIGYSWLVDVIFLYPLQRPIVQQIQRYIADHAWPCISDEYLELTYRSLPHGGDGCIRVSIDQQQLSYVHRQDFYSLLHLDHLEEMTQAVKVVNLRISDEDVAKLQALLQNIPKRGQLSLPSGYRDGAPATLRLVRKSGSFTCTLNLSDLSHPELIRRRKHAAQDAVLELITSILNYTRDVP